MDFNPDFSFQVPGAEEGSAHPWEFKGALAHAHAKDPTQSTIDEKISARRGSAHSKGTSARATNSAKLKAPRPKGSRSSQQAAAEAPSSSDAEDLSDDSEDEPLPGEDMSDDERDTPPRPSRVQRSKPQAEPASSGDEDSTGTTERSLSPPPASAPAAQPPPRKAQSKAQRREAATQRGDDDDDAARPASDDGGFYTAAPASTSYSAATFADLGLSRPLVKACSALGYTAPTPIQAACVPLALLGRDIVGSAITGSGKTAAFALPLLERLLHRSRRVSATHVLVLAPVRELAVQVHSMIAQLAQHTDVRSAIVVGGLSLKQQAQELRSAPDIVVATPGRIIDHVLNTMAFELDSLSALVLDEADRLLELGFQEEIKHIVSLSPRKRQTLLFSATMTERVQELIALSLQSPVRLAADRPAAAPAALRQEVLRLKGAAANDKAAVLLALCVRSLRESSTIVFCGQKWQAHRLKILLGLAGLPLASELHGDMTQAARLEALESFRTGASRFLLATDVAARGLDILGVDTIVNFDCPSTVETYLHRVGRTARAGAAGLAITFVEDGDRGVIKGVVKRVRASLAARVVPRSVVEAWKRRAEELQPKMDDILAEEREEKALRKAEMEATKASNMLDHEAEILARPKREWFLTPRQKAEIAKAAKSEASGATSEKDAAAARKAAKSKKDARNAEAKGAQATAKVGASTAHTTDTQKEMGTVKAAKAAARHLREAGQRPKEASSAALQAVGVAKRDKQKKSKRPRGDSLDSDDEGGAAKLARLASAPSCVYAGGGKSAKVRKPPSGPSKQQKARFARGGKGKGQFKGKSKFKRK